MIVQVFVRQVARAEYGVWSRYLNLGLVLEFEYDD